MIRGIQVIEIENGSHTFTQVNIDKKYKRCRDKVHCIMLYVIKMARYNFLRLCLELHCASLIDSVITRRY